MTEQNQNPNDSTEEFAAARRLNIAGQRNQDQETIDVAQTRASKLGKEAGFDSTDTTVQRILGNKDAQPK
jgi:hypothetical protein